MLCGVLVLSFGAIAFAQDAGKPDLKDLAEKIEKGTPSVRLRAINEAAAAGAAAKALRRPIAQAMLAREKDVRTAATDALTKIDSNIGGLATKILLNVDQVDFESLNKQGEDTVEPLVPILVHQYEQIVSPKSPSEQALARAQLILNCLFTHAPDDLATNRVILKALKSAHVRLQHTGVVGARSIKDGKQGVSDILRIAKVCTNEGVRVDAIVTLQSLADAGNKAAIVKGLKDLQLDKSETVRRAAGDALEKVEGP